MDLTRTVVEQLTAKVVFTITAEILARSLANFYRQYADRHEFEICVTRQQARAGNSTFVIVKKIDVSF